MKTSLALKLSIAAFIVLILGGTLLLVRYGVAPQTISIMTPSFFDQPEQIGAVFYRRLYDPLTREKLVVFGIPPNPAYQERVLSGFLEAAQMEKHPYDLVLKEPSWKDPARTGGAQIVNFDFNQDDPEEMVQKVKELTSQGKHVLIYTVSLFSSHLIAGNAINRFEATWGAPVFAITTGTLSLAPEFEGLIDPPCVGSARDIQGLYRLGCAMMFESRGTYRKHLVAQAQKRFVAIATQQGGKDYLVQLIGPGGDSSKPFTSTASELPPLTVPAGSKLNTYPTPAR
jgi:hypothetical protein